MNSTCDPLPAPALRAEADDAVFERAYVEGLLRDRESLWHALFAQSRDAVVVLDDAGKVFETNQRFADLLGYATPEDWARPGPFTQQYVDRGSQRTLVATYQHAMEHQVAATIDVTWVRQDGTPVPTTVMLVPIAFEGELLALHFVTPR